MKLAALEFFTVSHRLPPSSKWAAALMLSADSIKGKKELRSTMNYVCTSKSQWWRCQQPREYKIVTGTSKVIIEKSHNIWHLSWFWAGLEYWKEQFGPIMYFEASSQESTKLLQVHPKPLYIEKSHGAVGDFYEIYLRFGLVLSRLAMLKKIL